MNLTVGELLKFIEDNNIPNDAKVLYERIENVYFDECDWQGSIYKQEYENEESYAQFIPAFTTIKFNDDNNLYLTAHF